LLPWINKTIQVIFMKIIFLLLALSSANVLANDQVCKDIGDKAQKIMEIRQGGTELLDAVEMYKSQDDKEMVFAAYEVPRYDTLQAITNELDAFNTRAYQAVKIKSDEVRAAQANAIDLFKNKYIKRCILGEDTASTER